MEFERWSGKSVRAVEQDFYGRMLLATLSACLASEAEPLVAAKTEKCAHRYQVNQTRTLSTLRDHIVSLLLSTRFRAWLNKLIPKLAESPSVVRPGRTSDLTKRPFFTENQSQAKFPEIRMTSGGSAPRCAPDCNPPMALRICSGRPMDSEEGFSRRARMVGLARALCLLTNFPIPPR